jgi:hypothetical protein
METAEAIAQRLHDLKNRLQVILGALELFPDPGHIPAAQVAARECRDLIFELVELLFRDDGSLRP